MKSRARKLTGWFVALVLLGCGAWLFVLPHFLYGPVAKDTPLMREIAGMHDICTKLVYYAEEHHALPTSEAGKTIDSLVASGILSTADASYLRDHDIQFRGFDPSHNGPDVVVLEAVFTNTQTPRRIVGYNDGRVVTSDLEMTK